MSLPLTPEKIENHKRLADLLEANALAAAKVQHDLVLLAVPLARATEAIQKSLLAGGKLICCGNGGSACDASHFVAEILGRYVIERPGFPAIDLTTNSSLTTALINDYPPEEIFARQVDALANPQDIVVGFTTSGNSANVRLALQAAKTRNATSIAFLGKGGGQCKGIADIDLIVPSDVTARIQESHLLLYHTICEALDPVLAGTAPATQN